MKCAFPGPHRLRTLLCLFSHTLFSYVQINDEHADDDDDDYYYYLAAVRCPAFVLRVVSSTDTSVGMLVNVSCPAGQKLQTGHTMTKTLCTRSGDWFPQVPDCVGKLSVHY